ncbi:cysteine hydrolase family protein [Arthrobacter sp. AL08]|uniref:cysteine hydrolase family protein n=1 Tax=unclassified Arthrobacter TaxID=235627 RepID=UPI00249A858F|nr:MULTISPECIES: cysteine hydrolase family protein [unclassified Arthrobacter]MDI3243331.1 cysteine hydrolase family protein [Arthrobacter sp. AL05]MDI3279340.1 cysteine hydrolase family protein [Arthrobacter sp. AL08]
MNTNSSTPALGRRAALVIVDAQQGFDDAAHWGPRDNPSCEANISALLSLWQETGRPIVFVRHDSTSPSSPLHPDNPGNAFKDIITGTPDLLVRKSVNSSFHGTPDLHAWLQENGIEELVVCGITTNHCCETTARVGGNLGYRVVFPLDATHTFDRTALDGENVSAAVLSRITGVNLHGEFATVVTTASLLEQLEAAAQ